MIARTGKQLVLAACATPLLLFATSCEKPAAPPVSEPVATLERAEPKTPVGGTQTVLRKKFTVKTTAEFPFEIPAHAFRPHLHGIFESYAGEVHGVSDDTANLDFLILNEEQYTDFQQNRPGETMFAVESSHNQAINFDLPASLDHPMKYYLIFRSTSAKGPAKVVQADFHVEF